MVANSWLYMWCTPVCNLHIPKRVAYLATWYFVSIIQNVLLSHPRFCIIAPSMHAYVFSDHAPICLIYKYRTIVSLCVTFSQSCLTSPSSFTPTTPRCPRLFPPSSTRPLALSSSLWRTSFIAGAPPSSSDGSCRWLPSSINSRLSICGPTPPSWCYGNDSPEQQGVWPLVAVEMRRSPWTCCWSFWSFSFLCVTREWASGTES